MNKLTKEEKVIKILIEEIYNRSFEANEMSDHEKQLWKSDKLACIYSEISEPRRIENETQ